MKNSILFILLLAVSCPSAFGQSTPNIDFETGTTANWSFYTGTFSGAPLLTPTATAAIPGRHTLTSGSGVDAYGGFPVVAPDGGNYSLKLGTDTDVNQEAQRARYYIHIPSGTTDYSLIYHYAVVFQNPAHAPAMEPRMEIEAYDSVTGIAGSCDSIYYINPSGAFSSSSVGTIVSYMPWTTGTFRFPGMGGHTVAVDFATSGCGYGGHFGYGYVDMTSGLYAYAMSICDTDTAHTISLLAPWGYSAYSWHDSGSYSSSYGTTVGLSVATPTVTTTYAVVLTPYAGYGCSDTLYTRVTVLHCGSTTTGTGIVNNRYNVDLYPNPATGELNIKMTQGAYNACAITNTLGEEMMRQDLAGTGVVLNVTSLPPGVYYITFSGSNGTKVEKFVKI
jgi:type IX secretion system substrate protein